MKKLLFAIPVFLLFLSACGSTYDPEIEEVIDLESQHLSDQGEDVDLTRDNTDIYVYADGGYVEIRYDAAGGEQQAVYEELEGGSYERHEEMPEEAENVTREYEEENR